MSLKSFLFSYVISVFLDPVVLKVSFVRFCLPIKDLSENDIGASEVLFFSEGGAPMKLLVSSLNKDGVTGRGYWQGCWLRIDCGSRDSKGCNS